MYVYRSLIFLTKCQWAIPEYFFLKTLPGILDLWTLPLEIPEKKRFHPWKFCKIV